VNQEGGLRRFPKTTEQRKFLFREITMAIDFNHTILLARDSKASAKFMAEILGLPAPRQWGPFFMVTTENGANLDYMTTDGDIVPQHYAFLTSETEFDEIFDRIQERDLPYWADPGQTQSGKINHQTAGGASISGSRTGISLKSSPANTAAAAGILEGPGCSTSAFAPPPISLRVRPGQSRRADPPLPSAA
jgi:hypothetical protein